MTALGAIDSQPRFWTGEPVGLLSDLARLTVSEIKAAAAASA